jgi:hypothetical protein
MVKVACQLRGQSAPEVAKRSRRAAVRGLVGQLRRPGGGHDAPAGFHEQRVAGDGAQLVQQVAHGRLGDAQALRAPVMLPVSTTATSSAGRGRPGPFE